MQRSLSFLKNISCLFQPENKNTLTASQKWPPFIKQEHICANISHIKQ